MYRKGETICKDFQRRELMLLVSGSSWCVLSTQTSAWKLSLLFPGSLIGASGMLDEISYDEPLFEFVVAESCEVLAIPTRILAAAIEARPALWRPIAEAAIRYHSAWVSHFLGMYVGSIRNRVIRAIYQFGLNSFVALEAAAPMSIVLSQEDLASLVHSSRQHVNKALRRLESEGLVRVGYKKIEIVAPHQFAMLARALIPSQHQPQRQHMERNG